MEIEELQLPVGDLVSQREFYANVLGFPARTGEDGILGLRAGSSTLSFTQGPRHWSGVYHFAFNIPEDRFDEAKAWAAQRVALLRDDSGNDEFNFEHWNAHSIYFYDPHGNIVEFIARHDLAGPSGSQPFSGQSTLCISEIGLATDDVTATVRSLESALRVGIYDGAGSDTFTAVGDVHGLFIVVKAGRIWFPETGKPAELLPIRVIVRSARGERYAVSGVPYRITSVAR